MWSRFCECGANVHYASNILSIGYLIRAVQCYPCRLVPMTSSTSLHFHGDNTGSNPVGDANKITNFRSKAEIPGQCGGHRNRFLAQDVALASVPTLLRTRIVVQMEVDFDRNLDCDRLLILHPVLEAPGLNRFNSPSVKAQANLEELARAAGCPPCNAQFRIPGIFN